MRTWSPQQQKDQKFQYLDPLFIDSQWGKATTYSTVLQGTTTRPKLSSQTMLQDLLIPQTSHFRSTVTKWKWEMRFS